MIFKELKYQVITDEWKIIDKDFIVDKPMYIKVGKRKIILVIPPGWEEVND